MQKKEITRELKKQGYNLRSIQDYFRYCRYYKKEVSIQGFKDYGYTLVR